MKSLLKIVLSLVGVLVTLVVVAGVVVATLDPNQHKDWIVNKFHEKTGRTLSIDGKIALSYYPWLGVEVNGVTMGNAQGFGKDPFLKVDHFNARVKLLPLLREQYEIDTVHLQGASFNLSRRKDGVTNWADLGAGKSSEGGKPIPLTAIVLGGVDIRDVQVNWTDDTTGTHDTIKDLTVSTGELTYGKPIQLAMSLSAAANRPALDGTLKMHGVLAYDLKADRYGIKPLSLEGTLRGKNIPGGSTKLSMDAGVDVDLAADTASLSDLSLKALDTQVSGSLDASNLRAAAPAVKAALDVQGKDLAMLFKVAEIEPLASQIAQLGDRSFSLNSRVDADLAKGDVDVPQFKGALLGATLSGQVQATGINTKTPGAKGNIDASGPDLPTLLRVLGRFESGKSPMLPVIAKQMSHVADRSFRVQTTFDADMKRGSVDVPTLTLKLAGTSVQGRLKAGNIQTPTPSVSGTLNAQGPDLPLLMRIAGRAMGGKQGPITAYGRQLAKVPDKSFTVKTEFDADMKSGNVKVPTLTADALGIGVNGQLNATNMQSNQGSVSGHLTVNGEKLPPLLKAIGQAGLADALRSVKFDTAISGTRGDMNLKPMSLQATVASKETGNKPVNIALDADTRVNLDAQSLKLDNFKLQGLGLNVKGNVAASKIKTTPEFSGAVDVGAFDLRDLMLKLNQTPPVTADPKALRSVAFKSQFAGSADNVKLDQLEMHLDNTTLKGNLSVNKAGKSVVRFGLDVDQINADRYLPPPPAEGAAPKAAAGQKAAPEPPAVIPVALLRTLDVQGELNIGQLTLSKINMRKVKLTLSGKNGILNLDPADAVLYQGTHSGKIGIDATGKAAKVTINSQLRGVQVEPLLRDVTGQAKLRGVANFNANLVTVGKTSTAFKKHLNGKMSFQLQNAAIKGVNYGKLMRQAQSLKDNFTLSVNDKEETDLSEVTGNPVAQNGVVHLDDLNGAAPGLRITGKGVLADLPANRMDYTVTTYLVATSKGAGGKDLQEGKLEGVPLDCRLRGPLDSPKRECDASKLIGALGIKALQGVLGGAKKATDAGQTGQTTKPQDAGKQLLNKALEGLLNKSPDN